MRNVLRALRVEIKLDRPDPPQKCSGPGDDEVLLLNKYGKFAICRQAPLAHSGAMTGSPK